MIEESATRFNNGDWFHMRIDTDEPSCVVSGFLNGESIEFPHSIDRLKLIQSSSLGTINTSSTTEVDLSKNVVVNNVNAYDLLILETSVKPLSAVTAGTHAGSVKVIALHSANGVAVKENANILSQILNFYKDSTGKLCSKYNSSNYGVYSKTPITFTDGTLTLPMYAKYDEAQTGTINNEYVANVYGVNLSVLLGE